MEIMNPPFRERLAHFFMHLTQSINPKMALMMLKGMIQGNELTDDFKSKAYLIVDAILSSAQISDDCMEYLYEVVHNLLKRGRSSKKPSNIYRKSLPVLSLIDFLLRQERPLEAYQIHLESTRTCAISKVDMILKNWFSILSVLIDRTDIPTGSISEMMNVMDKSFLKQMVKNPEYNEYLLRMAFRCYNEESYEFAARYLTRVQYQLLSQESVARFKELQFNSYQRGILRGKVSKSEEIFSLNSQLFSKEQKQALTINWMDLSLKNEKYALVRNELLKLMGMKEIDKQCFKDVAEILIQHLVTTKNTLHLHQILARKLPATLRTIHHAGLFP
jgi:hypothetical protein